MRFNIKKKIIFKEQVKIILIIKLNCKTPQEIAWTIKINMTLEIIIIK
jgi:hypothetical protein